MEKINEQPEEQAATVSTSLQCRVDRLGDPQALRCRPEGENHAMQTVAHRRSTSPMQTQDFFAGSPWNIQRTPNLSVSAPYEPKGRSFNASRVSASAPTDSLVKYLSISS